MVQLNPAVCFLMVLLLVLVPWQQETIGDLGRAAAREGGKGRGGKVLPVEAVMVHP